MMASRAPMVRQHHDQQRRSPSSVSASPSDYDDHYKTKGGGMAASDVKHVTPPPPPQTKNNNNTNVTSSSRTHPEMVVDARVLDELLLVCSVIGSTTLITDPTTGCTREEFVPVTDCLNWLQDLQRALRRDHETYRPVCIKLGQWKVVCQKLLPLVMSCRYDSGLVMTVCKILVILTKPLSEAAVNAGRLTIDIKNKKISDSVIQEQMLLRENAIEQSDLLMEYKHLFVKHPSHHYAFKNNANQSQGTGGKKENSMSSTNDNSNGGGGNGLLSIFTSLLAEPLSKTGSSRTSADHLTIELVLHLIRNLLCISPLNTFGSTEKSQFANQLHRELLVVLQEEMILDVLVCVGQEVERRENSGYNLLLMEILSCLIKGQDPSDVARWDDGMIRTGAAPIFSAPISIVDKKRAITRTVRTTTTSGTTTGGGSASGGGQDLLKS